MYLSVLRGIASHHQKRGDGEGVLALESKSVKNSARGGGNVHFSSDLVSIEGD